MVDMNEMKNMPWLDLGDAIEAVIAKGAWLADQKDRIMGVLGYTKETADNDIRLNIIGAYLRIQRSSGSADDISMDTIKRVIDQLQDMVAILNEEYNPNEH